MPMRQHAAAAPQKRYTYSYTLKRQTVTDIEVQAWHNDNMIFEQFAEFEKNNADNQLVK